MLDLTKLNPQQQEQLNALLASMADSPARRTREKRSRKKETIKYLLEEQIDMFFRAITSVRDVAVFRVIYHRGLRASELGDLQLSDWRRDRNPNRIRFSRKKGSDGGEYMLTSKEVRALRAWLRVRGDAPGPLFPSRRGKGISQQMLDVLMKRYGKLAGLPPELCHTHSLKHSCATHLLNKGPIDRGRAGSSRAQKHPVDTRIREVLKPTSRRTRRSFARLVITASCSPSQQHLSC